MKTIIKKIALRLILITPIIEKREKRNWKRLLGNKVVYKDYYMEL
jgi:hypothetical protein